MLRKRVRLLAAGSLLLVLTGSLVAVAEESVVFSAIAYGTQSGIRSPLQSVIRTDAQWRALWRKHVAGSPQGVATPVVDFSRDMVIGVFAGEFSEFTRVSIVRISREANQLVVMVKIGAFDPGPVPEGAPVRPFYIIRLAQSKLPIVFMQFRGPQKDTY